MKYIISIIALGILGYLAYTLLNKKQEGEKETEPNTNIPKPKEDKYIPGTNVPNDIFKLEGLEGLGTVNWEFLNSYITIP